MRKKTRAFSSKKMTSEDIRIYNLHHGITAFRATVLVSGVFFTIMGGCLLPGRLFIVLMVLWSAAFLSVGIAMWLTR